MHHEPSRDVAPGNHRGAEPAAQAMDAGVAALFPIRVVARLTGINPVTIRAWERRYQLVSPERTPGGHRLYSRADVEILRAASRLVEQGLAISRATRLLDEPAPRRESRDDGLLGRFLERLQALDDDGMSAAFEASLARRSAATDEALLDQLPSAVPSLPRLEQHFLNAWLEGLLAFRAYQRMGQARERRVLVCSPAEPVQRTWALVFALGLIGSGLRPVLLAASNAKEMIEAAGRTGCVAVILSGGAEDWPGIRSDRPEIPVFLESGADGFLPLGNEIDDARNRVIDFLRDGDRAA